MRFEVAKGSVHKRSGKWRGRLRYREVADDGTLGQWTNLSKTWDIKSFPDSNKGRGLAEKELSAWREKVVADLNSPKVEKVSHDVADYVEWVAKSKDGSGSIEASTYDGYRKGFARIRARFGGTDIADLRAEDVQSWINDMKAEGLSAYTVWHFYGPLRQAMTYAFDADVIPRNPCKASLIKLPPKQPCKPHNPLDADGARMFWQKLGRDEETPITMGARLMLIGGLRNEEVCGLRWGDVTEEGGHVVAFIEQAIGVGSHADGTGGSYAKPPKSRSGRRRVDMGAAMIVPWRAWKEQRRLAYVEPLGDLRRNDPLPDEYYVLGDVEGNYLNPTSYGRNFKSLAEVLGIRGAAGRTISPYDLRHTFADLIDRSGASHKSAQTLMGHSSYKTTEQIYTSVDLEGMKAAADGVSAFLEEPVAEKRPAEVLPLRTGTD